VTLAPLLTALLVVGLLVVVTRWVFRPSRPNSRPRRVDASDAELGLLTVVVSGVSRRDATERRASLDEAGIRSSISVRRDGAVDVLVFVADAEHARLVLGG
jgi:hypothetical protein